MRKLVLISFLFALTVKANDIVVPEYMKGAIIIVKTKDGKEYKFSGDKYAVVIRSGMSKQKSSQQQSKGPMLVEQKKHSVRGYVGYGPNGLKTKRHSSSVTVEPEYNAVFGFGYTYRINETWGIGASYLTNQTELLNLDFNF